MHIRAVLAMLVKLVAVSHQHPYEEEEMDAILREPLELGVCLELYRAYVHTALSFALITRQSYF